jgi:hypothetical protein
MAVHTAPTLIANTSVLGIHNSSFFNRVLEGFATIPAALVGTVATGSAGCFNIDEISYTGGRAIVAGNVVTIPESRTLTGVVNNHMLPGTTLPTTDVKTQWYGLWLRKDGVMRVGPLPVYLYGVGIPGASMYRLLPGNTDSGYYPHDYTLVNLVWSYQGNTAGAIRFAGITHVGGNVWVYQQARRGNYLNPVTWNTYVDHKFKEENLLATDIVSDVSLHMDRATSTSITGETNGLPGIPSSITCTGIFNIRFKVSLVNASSRVVYYMLHDYNEVETAAYSISPLAPPNTSDPTGLALNLTYDVLLDGDYGSAIWSNEVQTSDGDREISNIDTTIVNPYVRSSDVIPVATTAGVVAIGSRITMNPSPATGDTSYFHIRTLGFMWDRYNAGGIMI